MIPFDLEKIHIRYVMLKTCTTALGGSVSIVDDIATTNDPRGREKYTRVIVPMALIRSFITLHKTSQYLKPVPVALTTYENHVVAIERHPLGSAGTLHTEHTGLFEEGPQRWRSRSERNVHSIFEQLMAVHPGTWYIDGKYVYNYTHLETEIQKGDKLSSDGKFRTVCVNAIKLADINDSTRLCVTMRTCLAFISAQGKYAVTPPVWKSLEECASSQLSKVNDRGNKVKKTRFRFDDIDKFLAVNLNFILQAGKELSEIFGPEIMEPLNLPKLMIQLQTVNLPSVANSVKSTFDTGFRFTHACAWLIGLIARTNTFESYITLRRLLKYLTQKGIFRKNMFTNQRVFKPGFTLTTVPVKTKKEALTTGDNPSVEEWIRRQRVRGGSTTILGNAVTGLHDNEEF